MKTKYLIAFSFITLSFSCVHADERKSHSHSPSWSYVEASFLEYDMDVGGIDTELEGYKVKLSLDFGSSLFGIIDRGKTDGKLAGSDFDFDTQGYGFGFKGDQWYASYTYNEWDLDGDEFDVDTLRVGIRNQLTENFEFNASYSWNDIEDADNDDGFQFGIAYKLQKDFFFVAEYETIGGNLDIDYLSAGFRFSF